MGLHTASGARKYLTTGECDAFLRQAELADRQVRTLCMTLAYAGLTPGAFCVSVEGTAAEWATPRDGPGAGPAALRAQASAAACVTVAGWCCSG